MKQPTFAPLQPFHVKHLVERLQARQRFFKDVVDDQVIAAMVAGPAKAALHDGMLFAAAGLIDEKDGRARAWAMIGDDIPSSFWPAIVAEMRAGIDAALHPETGFARRVWAETLYDWPQGHKLLLHLGMSLEGVNRGAFAGGRHGATYARVRGDVEPLPVRWRALIGVAEQCLWEDSMGHAIPWAVEEARRQSRAHGWGRA